jgi:hypothetical protein
MAAVSTRTLVLRPLRRTVFALGAAPMLVAVSLGFATTACAKDGASYKAGWATGVGWARETIEVAGVGGVPDAEVLGTCPRIAKSAENTLTYYYNGGRIPGASITQADFVAGCIDGARSVIG